MYIVKSTWTILMTWFFSHVVQLLIEKSVKPLYLVFFLSNTYLGTVYNSRTAHRYQSYTRADTSMYVMRFFFFLINANKQIVKQQLYFFLKEIILLKKSWSLKNSSSFLFDDRTPKYHNIPLHSVKEKVSILSFHPILFAMFKLDNI